MRKFFHWFFRCPGLKAPAAAWNNPFKTFLVRCSVCGQFWDCVVEIGDAPGYDPGIACWERAE